MFILNLSPRCFSNSCDLMGQASSTSSKSGIMSTMDGACHSQPAPRSDWSKALVIPCLARNDMSWVAEVDSNIHVMLYHVEEWDAPLHPPRNKGHEALAYLTYMIDHYHALADLAVFMHAHRYAHHNNNLLGLDAVQIVNGVASKYVSTQGYMNLHCSHTVGCPAWLKLHENQIPLEKQEQDILAKCWRELYPQIRLPVNLAQPCCGQFALSKHLTLSKSLEKLVHLRDWLLRTTLNDYFSGRIWEYLWHFVFLQEEIYCVPTEECLCQGFHVCPNITAS